MKNKASNGRGMESYGQGIGKPFAPGLITMAPNRHQESEILMLIKQIEEHVRVMGIGPQFARDRRADEGIFTPESPETVLMQHLQESGKPLNEAGAKRLQIFMELARIGAATRDIFKRLETVRQEIDKTQRDDNGRLVDQPFPQDLERGDFVQTSQGTAEAGA